MNKCCRNCTYFPCIKSECNIKNVQGCKLCKTIVQEINIKTTNGQEENKNV